MNVLRKNNPEFLQQGEADYYFQCPGCGCEHGVWITHPNYNNAMWSFNGSMDKPTFSPSLNVKYGDGVVCHSEITNGMIKFLSDCTHKLKGQTVPIPPIE